MPNQIVIFGHRGVGKTSFMNRLSHYWAALGYVFLDLDQEIENTFKTSVSLIFKEKGEAAFREYELDIFKKILAENKMVAIAVGGGFPVQKIPSNVHALWLRRNTDKFGRIFFDRPKLNIKKTDLEEYFERAKDREIQFKKRCDEVYFMPEGIRGENKFEKQIFQSEVEFCETSYLTLNNFLIKQNAFLNKIKLSGFEFRDDLLSFNKFKAFVKSVKPKRLILSFRDPDMIAKTEADIFTILKVADCAVLVDWALELGLPSLLTRIKPSVVSLHDFLPNENLSDFLRRLEVYSNSDVHLKASPLISTYAELEQLLEWQKKDKKNRSILPRSNEGRWYWFRQYMINRQKINFWKADEGSASDQPTLYQWISAQFEFSKFAAVLGSPVEYSRTPIEQQLFFNQNNCPIFSIDIKNNEFEAAVNLLIEMGLVAAAVTAPLKKNAFQLVKSNAAGKRQLLIQDENLGSLNTLYISKNGDDHNIYGTNTDLAGMQALTKEFANKNYNVLIFGGGGTLAAIKNIFPNALEYSARTGRARNGFSEPTNLDILIWAASPTADFLKLNFKPKYIIDLNYREDSLARSFAKKINAIYVSGDEMFYVQAEHQRFFWRNWISSNSLD